MQELEQRASLLIGEAFRRPELYRYLYEGPSLAFAGHLLMWMAAPRQQAEQIVGQREVEALVRKRNIIAIERTPMRLLELRYLLDMANLKHNLPGMRELYQRTLAAQPLVVSSLAVSDVYSITHTIFYMTDFGSHSTTLLPNKERSRLAGLATVLLKRMIRQCHWDLVAELLLARRCLGVGEDAMEAGAWRALAEAQGTDGTFVSLAHRQVLVQSGLARHEVDDALFLAGYHTCLVVLLAAALPISVPASFAPPADRKHSSLPRESRIRSGTTKREIASAP